MQKVTPFLTFIGQAEAAITFYMSVFEGAGEPSVLSIRRYGADAGELAGKVQRAVFSIYGQQIQCIDSPAVHAWSLTPAVSLFVQCGEEINALYDRLSQGGKVHMPLERYPFSEAYAWLDDRFDVSWQLCREEPHWR